VSHIHDTSSITIYIHHGTDIGSRRTGYITFYHFHIKSTVALYRFTPNHDLFLNHPLPHAPSVCLIRHYKSRPLRRISPLLESSLRYCPPLTRVPFSPSITQVSINSDCLDVLDETSNQALGMYLQGKRSRRTVSSCAVHHRLMCSIHLRSSLPQSQTQHSRSSALISHIISALFPKKELCSWNRSYSRTSAIQVAAPVSLRQSLP
jgi:hypothetical protein